MKLATARRKASATKRNNEAPSVRDTLSQIRTEGYEDYAYGRSQTNSYSGEEAEAYAEGWRQARLEIEGR